MRNIIYLLAFTFTTAFAQESTFTPKTHFIFEVNQDFGHLTAKDSLHEISAPSAVVGSTNFRFSPSILTKSGVFVEPFIQYSFLSAQSKVSNLNMDTTYANISNNNRFIQYYNGTSDSKTNIFGAGFNLLKRVSPYLSVGGGFQLQYRSTIFTDYFISEAQQKNANGQFVASATGTEEKESEANSIVWGIPMLVRGYLPIGKSNLTGYMSLVVGVRAYGTVGIGYSF